MLCLNLFCCSIFYHIDKSYYRPLIRIYASTLIAFQSWDINAIDFWDLICERLDVKDFYWNPLSPPFRSGVRVDDVPRFIDISEFMMSVRSIFVSYHQDLPHSFLRYIVLTHSRDNMVLGRNYLVRQES